MTSYYCVRTPFVYLTLLFVSLFIIQATARLDQIIHHRDLVGLAMPTKPLTLPPLPYSYDALEPVISKQIMQIHHDKHVQAYVNGYNDALTKFEKAVDANDVHTQLESGRVSRFAHSCPQLTAGAGTNVQCRWLREPRLVF